MKIFLAFLIPLVISILIGLRYTTYRPRLTSAPSPLSYQMTQEQLSNLYKDGAVHLPGVLSKEWLEYMQQVVEDRVNHPWIGSVPATLLGVYEYHQFDNWMVSPGFLDYLSLGPASSIARSVFPSWNSVRVLKESLFYKPQAEYPYLLAPLHVDCETGANRCPTFSVFRLWVTLDPVPQSRGVVFQKGTHSNPRAKQNYKVLACPDQNNRSSYFSFPMEAGDGLVWFGDTVHFAYGGNRRVVSVSLIEGSTSRFEDERKPHLSWDWYNHGIEDGDLISGPYFPQVDPGLIVSETLARDKGEIGYFTGKWTKMWPFIKNVLYNFGGSKKTRCKFSFS